MTWVRAWVDEGVEQGLQVGVGGGLVGLGAQLFLHRLLERLDLAAGGGVVGSGVLLPLRAAVLSGEIALTFRLWRRPKVKIGGRYRVGTGQIEVDWIELLPFEFHAVD